MNDVVPRLRHAAGTIKKFGAEDDEDILQDTTLMAARMMDSAEKAGRTFSAGNVAFFTTRAARSDRRSGYSGKTDAMSPRCHIDGLSRLDALDMDVEFESGDPGTLHDVIVPLDFGGHELDPSEEAGRNLDWEAFLAASPPRYRTAIAVLEAGRTMREAGQRCGIGDSAALDLKKRIAADLLVFFGQDVIRRCLAVPARIGTPACAPPVENKPAKPGPPAVKRPRGNAATPVTGPPDYISPTSAKSYLACSLRSGFEKVLKLRKTDGSILITLEGGTIR